MFKVGDQVVFVRGTAPGNTRIPTEEYIANRGGKFDVAYTVGETDFTCISRYRVVYLKELNNWFLVGRLKPAGGPW